MKFTLNWLKRHLKTEASLEQITEALTSIGLEVEEILNPAEKLGAFEVAYIEEAKPHPNADKLKICSVASAGGSLQIVCGASNARAGIKVVLANIGVNIPQGNFKIKKSKIRGEHSWGMLCSASELGIEEQLNGGKSNGDQSNEGIMELPADAEIGTKLTEALKINDPMIEIAITPNRGDCLSVRGVARDLVAKGLGQLAPLHESYDFIDNIDNTGGIGDISDTGGKSDIHISNFCYESPLIKQFVSINMEGLTNSDSPAWMQNFLQSVGVKPISALIDISNFITIDIGRPSHIYDADKLIGSIKPQIAQQDSKFKALDGKEYLIKCGDIIITDDGAVSDGTLGDDVVGDDGGRVVAIAGVIGGQATQCTSDTRNITIELANFDANQIALTRRRMNISTDASYRFERGVDTGNTKQTSGLLMGLLQKFCGGKTGSIHIGSNMGGADINNIDTNHNVEIKFPLSDISKKIGIEITQENVKDILAKLGFKVVMKGDASGELYVTAPSWRCDIVAKEDILEEIIRIYGYEKLTSASLAASASVVSSPASCIKIGDIGTKQDVILQAKYLLANIGADEVISFSFMGAENAKIFGFKDEDLIRIKNPIAQNLGVMRASIIPNLLNLAKSNINRGAKQINIFESGKVFCKQKPSAAILQSESFAGICYGSYFVPNENGTIRQDIHQIFHAKANMEVVIRKFIDIESLKFANGGVASYFHPFKAGVAKLGNNIIGTYGEIHPKILSDFNLPAKICGFEINLDVLPSPKLKKPKLFEANNLQPIERDFAFILCEKTPVFDLIQAVKSVGRNLITSVDVFDVYQGKNLEKGKKSVGLRIVIQPVKTSLKEEEITAISTKIINKIESDFNAILRKTDIAT